MRQTLFLCLLVFFLDINYYDHVTASLFFTSEHVQDVAEGVSSKCQCSKEKGTVTKVKSLLVGGLEIFPKKSLHIENAQTIYLYIQ